MKICSKVLGNTFVQVMDMMEYYKRDNLGDHAHSLINTTKHYYATYGIHLTKDFQELLLRVGIADVYMY